MKVRGSAVNVVPCDCGILSAPVGGDLCKLMKSVPGSQELFTPCAISGRRAHTGVLGCQPCAVTLSAKNGADYRLWAQFAMAPAESGRSTALFDKTRERPL